MPSYYNVFVGSENGLFKGINTQSRAFGNINNYDGLDKSKEIVSMCWQNEIEQTNIYYVTRDQHLVKYSSDIESNSQPFHELGLLNAGEGLIKGIATFAENRLYTCTEKGAFKLWSFSDDDNESVLPQLQNEFSVGTDIACVKKNPYGNDNFQVATGGQENDLKLWNLDDLKTPIFKAKNIPDNWIRLREPVWVMSIDFLDKNRILVGTGHHQVRLYDVKSGARRPSINLTYGKFPITSIVAIPDKNQMIAANTRGDMEMIDLRYATTKNGEAICINKYKSFQGTIKSMQLLPRQHAFLSTLGSIKRDVSQVSSSPLVATCGLDRFLRIHEVDTSKLVLKVYLKSRLNTLLCSSNEPVRMSTAKNGDNNQMKSKEEDELSNINSEDLGTDDLWSDMEQVIDDHPILSSAVESKSVKVKRKANERLQDFSSDSDSEEEIIDGQSTTKSVDDKKFKKPTPIESKNNKNTKKKKKT